MSEKSEYYKIEHVIASVDEESPAYRAGLRLNDLITHVQSQPVSNFTNPQLIHRMIACGNELSLKVFKKLEICNYSKILIKNHRICRLFLFVVHLSAKEQQGIPSVNWLKRNQEGHKDGYLLRKRLVKLLY